MGIKEKLKNYPYRYAIVWKEEEIILQGCHSPTKADEVKKSWKNGMTNEATIEVVDVAFLFLDEFVNEIINT